MRHFLQIFLFLTLIFIIFFSCERKKVNPNIKEYFPLATGNWWEYEMRGYEAYGDTVYYDEPFMWKIEVGAKKMIKGKEFFNLLIYWDGDLEDFCQYIRVEDEFLLITYLSEYYPDTIIDTLLLHDFQNRYIWEVRGMAPDPEDLPYEAKYVGRERIKSFDCLKINYIYPGPDDLGAYFYFVLDNSPNISFWYGKGVGITKMDAYYDLGEGEREGYEWRLRDYNLK